MNRELKVDANSIITRNRAEKLVNEAHQQGHSVIDLSDVEFISRSVADEFIHHQKESGVELRGLQDDVKTMIDAVESPKSATPS